MLKTRILLIGVSALVIVAIFMLPKVVVENDSLSGAPDSAVKRRDVHHQAAPEVTSSIRAMRAEYLKSSQKEKNAIFADSLANLYEKAGKFDSAAWFAEDASTFFNTTESWAKAGDQYYQAYKFAVDPAKQSHFAGKAQEFYKKVLDKNPEDLRVKTNLAMTYLSSPSPMQGIALLREVLAKDPENEEALFNMGMLSVQSGQYEKAVERLDKLVKINPAYTQARLLLAIALMKTGDKQHAKEQFEQVKQMDKDPDVHATVDSYLKDLK